MKTALDFLEWLKIHHSGKENAINACNMKHWGSRREIRFFVHDLRRDGHPICSGQAGYYYANKSTEVKQTLNFLNSIQEDLSKVILELDATYESMVKSEKHLE